MKSVIVFACFFHLSTTLYGQVDSEKLFNSFSQGERTNCASIALIKASLEVYGLNNLFVANNTDAGSSKFILKDNSIVLLNPAELVQADSSAGFVVLHDTPYNKELTKYAVLAYAVMAKHKQDLEKYKTYKEALEELEYGAYAGDVYKYLGFKNGKQIVKHRRLTGGNLCGLIAWSPAHAVYACGGYMDYHGTKKPLWAKYSGRIQIIK